VPPAAGRRSPAPADDDAEIAARLRLSATRLARRLRQESSSGLTPSQLSALAVVLNRGPLTLGELADHERVAPPSISKVAAKLEAEGLLERRTDTDDRRVARVRATPAGEALIEETRRRKTAWLAERVRQLEADDRARLADALDVLDELCAEAAP
jgi:DNA-binding MarR family transcriptional regulator